VDLALGHIAVYEIHIVNRFTGDPENSNVDYKITFGEYIHAVYFNLNPKTYYIEVAVSLDQRCVIHVSDPVRKQLVCLILSWHTVL